MALSTTFSTINRLGEISFISGTNYTLKFIILNQSGCPINLTQATCQWRMSPYGQDYTILQKTGNIISQNSFTVLLSSSDTSGLSGKFSHQPIITFSNGNTIIPSQGIITLVKGLQ